MARGVHSQVETYEARVVGLENEITSRDATMNSIRGVWTSTLTYPVRRQKFCGI